MSFENISGRHKKQVNITANIGYNNILILIWWFCTEYFIKTHSSFLFMLINKIIVGKYLICLRNFHDNFE